MKKRNQKIAILALSTMLLSNSFTYVKAAEVLKTNLALGDGVVATSSDNEAGTLAADKAIDGIVDYQKANGQSRWASNTTSPTQDKKKWLQVDLGEVKTFNEVAIEWERKNATNYIIELSDNGEEWRTVKEFTATPSDYRQVISFDEAQSARYVRLSIASYNAQSAVRNTDGSEKTITWNTVSVFELEVNQYKNIENIARTGTATANAFEGGALTANKVNDGNKETRWASEVRSVTASNPHWVQIELPEPKTVASFAIDWERDNVINYEIQASQDGREWETVWSRSSRTEEVREKGNFAEPKTAKYFRVKINDFSQTGTNSSGTTNTWNTVSIYEFELFGEKLAMPEHTLESVTSGIAVTPINKGDTHMAMPEVPEGYEIEFVGADYEQIIGADRTIHQPLIDTVVEVNFTVKKGDKSKTTAPIRVTVPGKYQANVGNEKPKVIPELAEWYGTEGDFTITDSTKIIVDSAYTEQLNETAKKFAADYKDIVGKDIVIEQGSEAGNNNFFLTLATDDTGLCNEGNIITVDNSIKIEAKAAQGAYYATRSILQILKQTETTIPQGIVRDYPKYKVRGFVLDVARKSYELESLKELAETMAWYKLNDLQVHLNDNYIFLEEYINSDKSNMEDAYNAYEAFRLESDVRNEQGEGITAKDLYYTKDDFRSFIQESREIGVNIVPEIDTPAHAMSITKVFKNLALEGWNPRINRRPTIDHLDLGNPESLEFVKNLFNEYMEGENPVFDLGTTVHVGTDEYEANAEHYRAFTDAMLGHVQDTGRTVRMWGGLTWLRGETPVRSNDVQINVWSRDWANPKEMFEAGYDLINTLDSDVYIVPTAGYYANYLNAQRLYNNWEPNSIGGTYIPAGDDQMLGGAYAIWNDAIDKRDAKVSEYDVFDRFFKPLPALAEKMWGDGEDKTFNELNELSAITGTAPNTNPYYTVDSVGSEYIKYDFEEETIADKSGNSYDSISKENVSFEKGKVGKALRLNGGTSYVETPIKKVGLPNSVSFWIKKDANAPEGEQIIFESKSLSQFDDYTIKAVDKNGKVGFTRERQDFSFNYELPENEWVHLTFASKNEKAMLYVNNELVDTIGSRPAVGTMLIPLEKIGSATNSFKGLIDEIIVGNGILPEDETVIDSSNFTVTTDNENALAGGGIEGPIRLAFDNNPDTWWHTNYSPHQALPATVEVDMKEVKNINKITYMPRQDGNANGRITDCDIYVKASESDEYKLISKFTWENNMSNKYAKFDEVEARYIKIVANAGAGNFATASEFFIHEAKDTPVLPEVDKSALNEYLAGLENVVEDNYTAESFEVFRLAKEAAEAVAASAEATQEDVNAALEDLKVAFESLEEKPSTPDVEVYKKHLEITVSIAEEITEQDLSNVVPVVVNEFKAALQEAKELLSDENATQDQIDASFNRLSEVMHMLSFEKGDKKALESLVSKIESLDKAEYISSTWNKLNVVLEKANNVLANENAMEEEVSKTYDELLRAFLELRLKPNKDKLQDLINKVESLDKNKYTKESWDKLEEKLAAAKAIISNEDVEKDEVDRARAELEVALGELVANADNENNDNSNNNTNGAENSNGGNNGTNKPGNNNGKGDGSLPKTGGTSAVAVGLLGLTAIGGGLILRRKKK